MTLSILYEAMASVMGLGFSVSSVSSRFVFISSELKKRLEIKNVYLECQVDVVRRKTMGVSRVIIWVIQVINPPTISPKP